MKRLEPAERVPLTAEHMEGLRAECRRHYPGCTEKEIDQWIKESLEGAVWINDVYQVVVKSAGSMVHLSIKRIDRETIHDWRDLQEIKNQLVGPECEAIELYPAESRRVDSANQYHLWASSDPTWRFPCGFTERLVTDEKDPRVKAKQRPLKGGSS
jgi:hypothetical protein